MNNIVIKKKNLIEFFFGLLLTGFIAVVVYNPSGLFSVSGNTTRLCFLGISVVSLIIVFIMPRKYKKDISFLKSKVLLYFILPDAALMLLSFIVTFLEHERSSIYSTTWYLFFSRFVLVLFLWSCIRLLGKKAVTYFFWGCALSYLYTLINYFRDTGFLEGLQKSTIGSYRLTIEVHNMTYIFGYLFLFFAIMDTGSRRSRILKSALCLIFVYFGQKRMVLIAVFTGLIIWLALHRFQGKSRKIIVRILCVAAIFIAMFYIYSITSGLFAKFVNDNDIETSSRLKFYTYFAQDLPFSPFYLGRGITYTDVIMASDAGMSALNLHTATTLHNDFLRVYIGVGMIPTIIYLGVIMYTRTLSIQKRLDERVGFFYFALTITYYMNWFASNAGLEMWCYSGYVICVLAILIEESEKKNEAGIRLQPRKL